MPEAPSAMDRHSSDLSDPSDPSRELSDEELSTLFATDACPISISCTALPFA